MKEGPGTAEGGGDKEDFMTEDPGTAEGGGDEEGHTGILANVDSEPVAGGGVTPREDCQVRLEERSRVSVEGDGNVWPGGQRGGSDLAEASEDAVAEREDGEEAGNSWPQTLDDEALELVGQRALDALPGITQMLWNGSRLKSLKLLEAGLGATPASFSLLSRPLAVNHVLLELDVSSNQIDCLGMALLATSLCHNSSIERLRLANNRIAANGGRHLAQALKCNHGLVQLDLSHNSLGPSGASCVAMALNFNTSLADLRIAANALGDEAACFFAEAIKRQGTLLTRVVLTKIDLANNGISSTGAEALLRALHVSSLPPSLPPFPPAPPLSLMWLWV